MNSIYIIQDDTGYAIGATVEKDVAIKMVSLLSSGVSRCTYREIPFYKNPETEITLIAGPIPAAYFPSSERTLMGDFKADAE